MNGIVLKMSIRNRYFVQWNGHLVVTIYSLVYLIKKSNEIIGKSYVTNAYFINNLLSIFCHGRNGNDYYDINPSTIEEYLQYRDD